MGPVVCVPPAEEAVEERAYTKGWAVRLHLVEIQDSDEEDFREDYRRRTPMSRALRLVRVGTSPCCTRSQAGTAEAPSHHDAQHHASQ